MAYLRDKSGNKPVIRSGQTDSQVLDLRGLVITRIAASASVTIDFELSTEEGGTFIDANSDLLALSLTTAFTEINPQVSAGLNWVRLEASSAVGSDITFDIEVIRLD